MVMDRREFLSSLGVGAVFALTASCLSACKKQEDLTAVDFTLDLTNSSYAALKTNGGYVVKDSVVVARTTNGDYVAATQKCSHEGQYKVYYDKTGNQWTCSAHGATFSLGGSGTNSKGSGGLTVYKTSLTGNSLRVYS